MSYRFPHKNLKQTTSSARNIPMQNMKTPLYLCMVLSLGFVSPNPLVWNSPDNTSFQDVQNARIGSKVCMRQLGCFEITPDFYHPSYRPINMLPQDRASIPTKFELYTKKHPMEEHFLDVDDPDEIKESPFDPSHKTMFIVHGFIDSRFYVRWMEHLKNMILLHGEFNVIIVDWSKGNGLPYTQATANTRVVGAEIAQLIKVLQKMFGISPMDCHIVGHSLGSHIAGYAGERLKKLGRITALDPAQPYFQNMPPSVRVDPTDADFVDVIHTDSSSSKFLALGMSQPCGHVDFYPNNGMTQPGCSNSAIHSIFLEGLFDALRQFVSCNHQRAVVYFTYSLNFKKALPLGHQCRSWEDYRNGLCYDCGKEGEKCAVMGMQADQFRKYKNDSSSIKMYLSTAPAAPFWVFSYQITIKLAKPSDFKDRSGEMYITIQGSKNIYSFKLVTKSGELVHGATYKYFVAKQEELGKMKSVTFKWISAKWNFFRQNNIFLEYVKITPMNIIDKESREKSTMKFCPRHKNSVVAKEDVLLEMCS